MNGVSRAIGVCEEVASTAAHVHVHRGMLTPTTTPPPQPPPTPLDRYYQFREENVEETTTRMFTLLQTWRLEGAATTVSGVGGPCWFVVLPLGVPHFSCWVSLAGGLKWPTLLRGWCPQFQLLD
jgi:hypothetical protein